MSKSLPADMSSPIKVNFTWRQGLSFVLVELLSVEVHPAAPLGAGVKVYDAPEKLPSVWQFRDWLV